MVFYSLPTTTGTKQSICSEIDRLCDTDDTSYTRLDKTSRINQAMEELVGEIISADGRWQWDDTNQADLPRGTGNLVEGQQQYSFTSEYLDIEMLEILEINGFTYRKIFPIDSAELGDLSPDQYFGMTSASTPNKGFPRYYDKQGDSFRLYPAPTSTSCTLTNGLRVSFKRTAVLMSTGTGTIASPSTAADSNEPGLPSPYHPLLAYMAAIPYCMSYKKDRVVEYERKVGSNDPRSPFYGGMKKALMSFYGRREKDSRKVGTTRGISFV